MALKLKVVINKVKAYITEHLSIINDDFEHINVDGVISVIYESISCEENGKKGYEISAVEQGIPKHFIEDFNKIHAYIVSALEMTLQTIKSSSYYQSDYVRFAAVLDAVLAAFYETFSKKHLNDIFAINGRLTPVYNEITALLEKRILQ